MGNRQYEHFGTYARPAGAVNADGYPDWLAGTDSSFILSFPPNEVRVVSGKDGSTIWEIQTTTASSKFAFSASGVGDLDADGHDDLTVCDPDARQLYLYSGRNGQRLATVAGFPSST